MIVATDDMILFWKKDSCFSNWYDPSWFEFDGHRFRNSEAGMMYQKAKLFGDDKIIARIFENQDPWVVKDLGKQVRGYSDAVWHPVRVEKVVEVLLAKFSQNLDIKQILIDSDDKILAEASPIDKIWGIGLAPDNPLARIRTNWRGLNLLGDALMVTREILNAKEL